MSNDYMTCPRCNAGWFVLSSECPHCGLHEDGLQFYNKPALKENTEEIEDYTIAPLFAVAVLMTSVAVFLISL